MLTIKNYIAPNTLDEAYEILMKNRKNAVLGGCGFLKLGSKKINTAIDLCNLNLNYIVENEEEILIGADTSLRELEESEIIKNYCGGVISEGVSNILGVQFRNMAKVGASVFSKYGFSDLIPSLLVLDAKIRLYNRGIVNLKDFLEEKYKKDILIEIILPKKEGMAVFDSLRKTSGDFSIINGAMYRGDNGEYRIALGSRPRVAKLASEGGLALEKGESLEKVHKIVLEEVSFGTNIRASKEYRMDMSKVLIHRMYMKLGDYYDK